MNVHYFIGQVKVNLELLNKMGNCSTLQKNCVFCEIVTEIDEDDGLDKDRILVYNNKYMIVADLHPAAKHHYLVIPKVHIKNPKALKGSKDIELVKEMYEYGKQYLQDVETEDTIKDSLFGFHYPPFTSIDHLHLHVICPCSSMNFTNSNLFKKDTWYFVSPEKLIEILQQTVKS